MYVAKVNDDVGNGLFASVALKAGTYIGEYTGIVAEDAAAAASHYAAEGRGGAKDGYLMRYPGEGLHVSALECGSLIRFINHGAGDATNVDVVPYFVDGAYVNINLLPPPPPSPP